MMQSHDGGLGQSQPANDSHVLPPSEAIRLLASVDFGRVVFTLNALPAIRPVNHVVDEGRIIIRTRLTRAISTVVTSADSGGAVVAYEADELDPWSRSGWSVVATGWARPVADPEQVSRYERLLQPWVNHADTVLAIEPQTVSGVLINLSSSDEPGDCDGGRRNAVTVLPENHVRTRSACREVESELIREATAKGLLLRRNRSLDPSAEGYGLYVLIADRTDNRLPDSKVAADAFLRGEGDTLDGIADDLAKCNW